MKKNIFFTTKRIYFHENNLWKTAPLFCLLADNNGRKGCFCLLDKSRFETN